MCEALEFVTIVVLEIRLRLASSSCVCCSAIVTAVKYCYFIMIMSACLAPFWSRNYAKIIMLSLYINMMKFSCSHVFTEKDDSNSKKTVRLFFFLEYYFT